VPDAEIGKIELMIVAARTILTEDSGHIQRPYAT